MSGLVVRYTGTNISEKPTIPSISTEDVRPYCLHLLGR